MTHNYQNHEVAALSANRREEPVEEADSRGVGASSAQQAIKKLESIEELRQGIVKLDSPLLDRHNDYIRIYIKTIDEDQYQLTDDGWTLHDLKTDGMELSSESRKIIFNQILKGYGVNLNEQTNELYTISRLEHLPERKNALLQAIISIGDMFVLSRTNIRTLFYEDEAGE